VSTYILHSPGSSTFESSDIETITPERYSAERVTKVSLQVIAIVVAISRYVLTQVVMCLKLIYYRPVCCCWYSIYEVSTKKNNLFTR
jgi:hypothetical protein